MSSSDWQLSLKLVDQPKSTFTFPEMMPGDVPPGGYRVATLKQLVAAQLPDSIPDPDLIGPLHLWHLYTSIHACASFHDRWLKPDMFLLAHIRAGPLWAQTQGWPDAGCLWDPIRSHHTHPQKDLARARKQFRSVAPPFIDGNQSCSANKLNICMCVCVCFSLL